MPYKESVPYNLRVSRGPESGETHVNKFGYSSNVTQTAGLVWSADEAHTYLSAADYVIVASDVANDATAGSGAITVEITGLLAGYTETVSTISCAGLVGVTSSVQFLRIYRMAVGTAGSGNVNDGAIYCIADAAGSTFTAGGVPTSTSTHLAKIDSSTSQTLMATWTVPTITSAESAFGSSRKAYVCDWWATSQNNKSTVAELWTREKDKPFKLKERRGMIGGLAGYAYIHPDQYPAGTDIEIRAKASSSSSIISAGFCVLTTIGD